MSNLQHRQSKIQERRKQTPWREFLMEIASRKPITLHKNKGLISRYPTSERGINITSIKDFETQRDDLVKYGISYDGNNFWSYLRKLFIQTTQSNILHFGVCENCDYADSSVNSKNIYLSTTATFSENILYSGCVIRGNNNVLESLYIMNDCSNIFSSISIVNSYNIFYSHSILDSNNIWFCSNCIGCSECILSNGLNNQQYMIEDTQYSKEEYFIRKNKILFQKNNFNLFFKKTLNCKSINLNCDNVGGSYLSNSENIEYGVYSNNVSGGRNICFFGGPIQGKNIYDDFFGGNSEDFYGVCDAGIQSNNLYCCSQITNSSNLYYSYFLESCSFCLGCIGLKNKSYCILNKQYSKEERYEKVDEIFAQMEADGTLGQFFPASMNPFYFNDTAAYLIDPSFTKEEVVAKGYLWRDEPIKVDIPVGATLLSTDELGQYEGFDEEGKRHIDPSIKDKIIQDEQGNVYRIVPMEYDFLMKYGLPLPRKHWLDRMRENFRIN